MIRMNRVKQLLMALLFVLLIAAPKPVQAADEAGLGVTPIPSSQQRDKGVSYFDLLLKAGQTSQLQVKLTNPTTKPIKVNVHRTTATTSDTGIIDYTGGANQPDKTLPVAIGKLMTGANSVTVPAKGTTTYVTTLKMPSQPLSGVLVGGLVFAPANQTKKTDKMGVVNQYQYSVAVLARNSNTILPSKLSVGAVRAARIAHVNQISVTVRNQTAAFANHIEAISTITNPDGKTSTLRLADAQMAPNSQLHQVKALGTNVKAGTYRVKTTVYWDKATAGQYADGHGNHYRNRTVTTKPVQVTAAKAKTFNHAAKQARGGMPMRYKWAIAIAIVVVLLLIATIIFFWRKKQKAAQHAAALEEELKQLKQK
ncbi:DUF916 domain-containing protein [Lacticaseibacillus sp. GG6-2]